MSEYSDGALVEFDDAHVELAAEIFAMLADPTRIRLVLALREDELSVNHLAAAVDRSQAAVSQHLAKLRMARMVTTRQEGNRVFYRLANDHANKLVHDAIFQAEHTVGDVVRHHHSAEHDA
jgi:DNA-binding transcriptional ArsR family regulator